MDPYFTNFLLIMNLIYTCLGVFGVIGLLIVGGRILNWVWLRPRKLENILRKQGFKGNPYKFFFGDVKALIKMGEEAKSKPIGLSDDILPRVVPGDVDTVAKNGI